MDIFRNIVHRFTIFPVFGQVCLVCFVSQLAGRGQGMVEQQTLNAEIQLQSLLASLRHVVIRSLCLLVSEVSSLSRWVFRKLIPTMAHVFLGPYCQWRLIWR